MSVLYAVTPQFQGGPDWTGVLTLAIAWLLILPGVWQVIKEARTRPPPRDPRVNATARKYILIGLAAVVGFYFAGGLYTSYRQKGRIDTSYLLLSAEVLLPIGAFCTVLVVLVTAYSQRRAERYWEERERRHREKHLRRRHGGVAGSAAGNSDRGVEPPPASDEEEHPDNDH